MLSASLNRKYICANGISYDRTTRKEIEKVKKTEEGRERVRESRNSIYQCFAYNISLYIHTSLDLYTFIHYTYDAIIWNMFYPSNREKTCTKYKSR